MQRSLYLSSLLFITILSFNAFGQTDEGFYGADALRGDLKQVNAVVHVNVTGLKIIDSMGSGNCETNKGAGYCLYELTGEVKEVFKGKIGPKILKFYIAPDADYPKERLLGEQVVFLNKNVVEKTKSSKFVTLENSTRKIEFDVIAKLRKIKKTAQ